MSLGATFNAGLLGIEATVDASGTSHGNFMGMTTSGGAGALIGAFIELTGTTYSQKKMTYTEIAVGVYSILTPEQRKKTSVGIIEKGLKDFYIQTALSAINSKISESNEQLYYLKEQASAINKNMDKFKGGGLFNFIARTSLKLEKYKNEIKQEDVNEDIQNSNAQKANVEKVK